jgi:4-amino-4-deoxy-L-arabinose transferase-like glycosyltransferase
MSVRSSLSSDRLAALAIAFVKLAAMMLAVRLGFSHVSDDDYSRTVIAQSFAHTPKLDPSGTSWLPMPFWIMGTAMMLVGRSLAAARAIAWTLGVLATLLPFVALRHLKVSLPNAFAAAIACALAPWSVWLAATTVPEGWTGPAVAAALLLVTSDHRRAWLSAAALLLLAALSRYEVWPACAVACVYFLLRARRTTERRDGTALLIAGVVAAIGPLMWMGWNAYAHDDPLHFFVRVSTFKQNSGAPARSVVERLIEYPLALAVHFPLSLVGLASALITRNRKPLLVPLLGAAAILTFLIVGDLKDGAPTHHPERALGAIATVFVALGVARFATSSRVGKVAAPIALAAALIAHGVYASSSTPGTSEADRRVAQIARGRALSGDPNLKLIVTPCQYEHFALIAASGTPERFEIEPITRSPVTDDCPRLRAP